MSEAKMSKFDWVATHEDEVTIKDLEELRDELQKKKDNGTLSHAEHEDIALRALQGEMDENMLRGFMTMIAMGL